MNLGPLAQGKDLLRFIPQRPPFVMVDTLYEVGINSITSGFSIAGDNILIEDSLFQESGMIENMAQTCALFAGYKANELNKEAPVGFIAGLKGISIKRLPLVGEIIRTKMEIVNELMNMQIALASIFDQDDTLIANGEFRIFIKED